MGRPILGTGSQDGLDSAESLDPAHAEFSLLFLRETLDQGRGRGSSILLAEKP